MQRFIKHIKKWHMFVFAFVLFFASFYVINLKFDRFYRVSGINNENRVLILKYMSEEDQEYLIENRIPVNRFITYIKYDEFKIQNYRYYNLLESTKRYKTKRAILTNGNKLKERLYVEFMKNQIDCAQTLVDGELEQGYIKEEDFRYDYVPYYTSLRPLYDDTTYVADVNKLVEAYQAREIENTDELTKMFSAIGSCYDLTGIKLLLKKSKDKYVNLVANPAAVSTVVNEEDYIANYIPKNLVLLQDIKRFEYSMYMTSESYAQLMALKSGMGDMGSQLLVRRAYLAYDVTSSTGEKKAGSNEYQLGTTVDLSQHQLSYHQFSDSKLSQWLEENAWKYGFILRYPHKKASITNHDYSSHTYRYVGVDIAKEMHDRDLSLEEYVARRGTS